MSLIRNEQTKLLANALDRASTACVTVGVLAPIAAALYDFGPSRGPGSLPIIIAAIAWIGAAAVLHLVARWILEDLRQ